MTRVNLKEEGKQCVTIQVEEARDPNVSGGPVGRESSSPCLTPRGHEAPCWGLGRRVGGFACY